MLDIIRNDKGRFKLRLNGYLYVKDKQVRETFYWKCDQFKKKCKGRVITIGDSVSRESNEHNHFGDVVYGGVNNNGQVSLIFYFLFHDKHPTLAYIIGDEKYYYLLISPSSRLRNFV